MKPKSSKETIIITTHGERTEIGKIFRLSAPTIRRALNGDTTVRGYAKIRKCAIERGATEMTEVENDVKITNKK
ncbi:MAG: hypothetical protein PHW82_00530 [Bacteroidales bacterium]|nr:hypothetical protein [Bacteroidales bacterium]